MSQVPTVKRRAYRPTVRLVNAAADLADWLGLRLTDLDQGSILDAARRKTGLSDWGDDGFLEPMAHAIEATRQREFTALGKAIQRQAFIHAVANRLRYHDFVKRHPEVLDVEIERPIFVLGFPRTGTTVLQNLLAQGEDRRGLQMWELTHPVPLRDDHIHDRAQRMRATRNVLRAAYFLAPEMGEVHYVDEETLEEDWYLFGPSFAVLNWDLQSGLREYGSWLMNDYDMGRAYRDYERWLKLLLWERPAAHPVLKCPEHLWFLDDLLETFPDACIVWTHRDPHKTIASYCSLISMQWRNLYGEFDPTGIGDHITERFHLGIERAMAARERHDPSRFFDIEFSDLIEDQVGTVRDICAYFDLEWSEATERRVQAWLDDERADERGAHKYQAGRYGLRQRGIHHRYADYIESFDVDTPAPRPRRDTGTGS